MTTSPQDARLLGHSIFSDCGRGVSLTLWHTASQLTFFLLQLALPQESTLSFIFLGTFKKPKLPIPKNILLKVVLAPCLKMFKGENMVYNFCWFNLKTTFFIFHFFYFYLHVRKNQKVMYIFGFFILQYYPFVQRYLFSGEVKKFWGLKSFLYAKIHIVFP